MTAAGAVTETRVKVADHAVGAGAGMITTVGLGSCVAIVLHDPVSRVGGLAHVLLPCATMGRGTGSRAKYADTAVPLLLEALAALGARAGIAAKIVGGASMFTALVPAGGVTMGQRNVDATLRALERAGVPVVGQDTGGEHGRSVSLDVLTGRVDVRSLKRGTRVL